MDIFEKSNSLKTVFEIKENIKSWNIEEGYDDCGALVIDCNPTSRSILVNQLKEFGVRQITQASRILDGRRHLEARNFDIVLCENYFSHEKMSGQDLLDDLRRSRLIPFSTVFIMVTAEATYEKVAEAAESALDGYLLKPHKPSQLDTRLVNARIRKKSLEQIFLAMERENFDLAAKYCIARFESKGEFWIYAARVGAELLLRLGRYKEAQDVYQAIIEAKTMPWAKLGVARAQIDAGQVNTANTTLEKLISEEPSYTDAYDVLGRSQMEMGKLDQAMETYKIACDMTPSSISRLQSLGNISFYCGKREDAEKILDKATRIGLHSKMFDAQSLLLLAFSKLELSDRKGLQRCLDDVERLLERKPDDSRLLNFKSIIDCLTLIQNGHFAKTIESINSMKELIKKPECDFESASNFLILLSITSKRSVYIESAIGIVELIGMRFCTNKPSAELLSGGCSCFQDYSDKVKECYSEIIKISQAAMALSLKGDPKAAVENLLIHGKRTLNSKLIETSQLVLQKYSEKIDVYQALNMEIEELTNIYSIKKKTKTTDQSRQPGGIPINA